MLNSKRRYWNICKMRKAHLLRLPYNQAGTLLAASFFDFLYWFEKGVRYAGSRNQIHKAYLQSTEIRRVANQLKVDCKGLIALPDSCATTR